MRIGGVDSRKEDILGDGEEEYSGEFKAKVAIEAIKGEKTASEIAGECGVHSTQIAQWKKQVMDEIPKIFSTKKEKEARKEE